MNKKILGLTAAFGLGVAGAVDCGQVDWSMKCAEEDIGKCYLNGEAVLECKQVGQLPAWVAGSIEEYNKAQESATSSSTAENSGTNTESSSSTAENSGTNTESSSSVVTPASSADATPASSATVAKGTVIDDFEEDNSNVDGFSGAYWYGYGLGNGSYANETKDAGTYTYLDVRTTEGGNSFNQLRGISGISTANDGVALAIGGIKAASIGKCTGGISYKYKGGTHIVEATPSDVTPEKGYDFRYKVTTKAADWTTVEISWDDMKQEEWVAANSAADARSSVDLSKITDIKWTVNDGTESTFSIDDIMCIADDSKAPTSSGSAIAGSGDLIDDFTDGNNLAEVIGKEAYWYAYEDGGKIGNEPNTEYEGFFVVDSANGYAFLKGVTGISFGAETYPSVGLGLPVDGALGSCTAISYKYKGSAHRFRAAMSTITPDMGYEHTTEDAGFPMAADWTPVTVSAADLIQADWIKTKSPSDFQTFSWGKVSKISWIIDEKIKTTGPDLYIDDVTCVGKLTSGTKTPQQSIKSMIAQNGLKASVNGSLLNISVAKQGLVKVAVFDMMGHVIESHSENMTAGSYTHSLANLSKGAYVVRVQQGSAVKSVRMQVR